MIGKHLIAMSGLIIMTAPIAVSGEAGSMQRVGDYAHAEYRVGESLAREASAALERSTQWLLARQQEDGSWSNPYFPALTAMPLWALTQELDGDHPAIRRAVDYLLSCTHPDGSIYRRPEQPRRGGGLANYNTAISMVALHAVGDPELRPVVLQARSFLARHQHLEDDIYRGGMGYDRQTDRAYTDLSNSHLAYEAMRLTEDVEEFRTGERVDLDWQAAREFLERVQNHPEINEQPWVTTNRSDQGGFAYHPEQTRAGTVTGDDGVVRFRSMPGMTYAGMLSYIYADVSRDDPRVQAAARWVARHFDLEKSVRDPEKKGTPAEREGLFYMYNVMAKGLAAYGQEIFTRPDGQSFGWRKELIERILSLQRIDEQTGHGYWVNDVGRYWESDAVLVTAYTMLALQYALQ